MQCATSGTLHLQIFLTCGFDVASKIEILEILEIAKSKNRKAVVHLRSISRDAVGRCPSIVAPHQPRLFARSSHQWVCTILVECQQDTTSTDKTIAIHVIVSNTLCIRSIRVLQVPQPSSDQTHFHYQTNPANHENTSAIRLE